MGTVTNILESKGHLAGDANCLNCDHRWPAVAPHGTPIHECPDCGLFKGVFSAAMLPEAYYLCHCGCASFFLSAVTKLAICALCGNNEEEGDRT